MSKYKGKGGVIIKIKVGYYLLDSNGMPEGRHKYEQVEINPDVDDGVGTLVEEALSKQLNVSKDKLEVISMT
ncbi:hypothetical protein [Domibacillus iocasae]|uniref:Uncharacterized protein n=1 Tax=Domibacillus iocasae TaxID=1714016 RepID=A0A1E7DSU8_9BACI|nr:hypothetical protein [Domibacillus iocasae]OES46156.1 hypothetical protein BA724_16415 [Domibacillus iocasae]